jgi:phytoene synthase
MTAGLSIDAAYAECARITKTEAKNFAYGIALLPPPKRRAMSALYAFARRIDDIADSDRPTDEKLVDLGAVDRDIQQLADGVLPRDDDAVMVGVHDAARRFAVPVAAFAEIVEGCRRDSTGAAYATFTDTEAYCRLVAGSVGRLSLGVFGHTGDPATAARLADDLGVALQVTNILRDVAEDRGMGRVYLPADEIKRRGCEPDLSGPPAAMADLVAHFATVGERFYRRGLPLLDLLDRRSRACVAAMSGIYRQLLRQIAAAPGSVLDRRVSLSTSQKLWVAAKSLSGATP